MEVIRKWVDICQRLSCLHFHPTGIQISISTVYLPSLFGKLTGTSITQNPCPKSSKPALSQVCSPSVNSEVSNQRGGNSILKSSLFPTKLQHCWFFLLNISWICALLVVSITIPFVWAIIMLHLDKCNRLLSCLLISTLFLSNLFSKIGVISNKQTETNKQNPQNTAWYLHLKNLSCSPWHVLHTPTSSTLALFSSLGTSFITYLHLLLTLLSIHTQFFKGTVYVLASRTWHRLVPLPRSFFLLLSHLPSTWLNPTQPSEFSLNLTSSEKSLLTCQTTLVLCSLFPSPSGFLSHGFSVCIYIFRHYLINFSLPFQTISSLSLFGSLCHSC